MIPSGRRPRTLPPLRSALALALTPALASAWLLAACARPSPPQSASAPGAAAPAQTPPAPPIGELVARLSEPGGDFNSDNLISNESSYLHVMGALRALGVRGGAYVGVGPDQNFSYIAEIRPTVAFIIDIRRDNLLVHLMYKALFARARNRAEYLALWTGRPVPDDVERWTDRPIDAIAAHFDSLPATPASAAAAHDVVVEGVRRSGVPVSDAEMAYVERVHAAFVQDGLGITFTSRGRMGRPNYPTLRQLVTERDLDGAQAGYLATEERFRFVKDLEARDLVIPVVGNLAGAHALAAIGKLVAERGEKISALYTSNVEQYLMRDGGFVPFAQTVARLPRDERSVIIRSYFGGFGAFGGGHPQSVPGYLSTQVLQTIDAFTAEQARGGFQTYYDVVTKGVVDLRRPRG
jgi:hypothetical protein